MILHFLPLLLGITLLDVLGRFFFAFSFFLLVRNDSLLVIVPISLLVDSLSFVWHADERMDGKISDKVNF